MRKTVTLVEINVYDKMIPLVSGYLESYARKDEHLRETYQFDKYTTTTKKPVAELLGDLAGRDSDVFAFSCYLWNMGRVKTVLPALLNMKPNAQILLGGPQVMHHAEDYLDPNQERMIVCNGEGEKTFANYLRELNANEPDLAKVRGLSFYRNGKIVTTELEERIKDLNEIPSPFLNGLFDGSYRTSIIETNRGCPFRCGFCFWGAATNDKVIRYEDDRIRDELSWLSKRNVPFIVIADANWGMFKRDIEFSKHIADCNKKNNAPVYVYFSAAKNSPARVAEITEIFTTAELFNSQPISLQSLNATTLGQVDRSNIKLTAFEDLQEDLNDRGISSFIELIWPLPGETLDSFKQGIESLCARNASHIVAYPHLLLHNTPLYERRDEFQLVTRAVQDPAAEAEVVVGTANVSHDEFKEGMWFIYSVLALYHTHSLHRVSNYLHSEGVMTYSELFSAFAMYCKNEKQNHPFSRFCESSIATTDYYNITNYPMVYHDSLHVERDAFDSLLFDFASKQSWWKDDKARVLFEIDQLNRPYIYSNTPFKKPGFDFEAVRVLGVANRSFHVEIPDTYLDLVNPGVETAASSAQRGGPAVFRLNHQREQFPFRPDQAREHNADYCYGMIMRAASILPEWSRGQMESLAG